MSSTAAKVPVCVTLPPDLIARADRIADETDRSRSYIVARALSTFCDQIEYPSRGLGPAASDTAAGSGGKTAPAAPLSSPVAAVRDLQDQHTRRQLGARARGQEE